MIFLKITSHIKWYLIKYNSQYLLNELWHRPLVHTGNKLAKFHGNIFKLSENIANSFMGVANFLTHTVQYISSSK